MTCVPSPAQDETVPEPTALSQRAWADPHRPRFHFVPPAGWLNDPNGLAHWQGEFHLFYQYNPDRPVHDQIHWGHATSTDLIEWVDRPIALAPSEGADQDGCWSGVLVDHDGVPTIVYSGKRGDQQRTCIAVGDPTLTSWTKDANNPVIANPPDGIDLVAYRDHCVWREDDGWHQVMGAGEVGKGGMALHYRSPDLRKWEYLGPLCTSSDLADPRVWTGSMWECVDLFELDGRHLLLVSVWDKETTHYAAYYIGQYESGRFVPNSNELLDHGLNHFYAPQTFRSADGRRVAFGWAQEARSADAVLNAGWSGALSLPRELSLDSSGRLRQSPAAVVKNLRREQETHHPRDLVRGERLSMADLDGTQLDLELRLSSAADATAEVLIRCTPDGEEQTRIVIDTAAHQLRLDRSLSSIDLDLDTRSLDCPIDTASDGTIDLRIIVDHSMIEIFVNGRALTARIYPTRKDATNTHLTLTSGTAHLDQFRAWTMASVWKRPRNPRPDPDPGDISAQRS